ncbi:hypothetical protein Tco_0314599, partial [Tanacetum coccineum]
LSKRTLRGRSLCFVLEMRNQVTPPDTCSAQAPSGGVTQHATEAEYIAASEAVKEAV